MWLFTQLDEFSMSEQKWCGLSQNFLLVSLPMLLGHFFFSALDVDPSI
jgi:hypothetical protein